MSQYHRIRKPERDKASSVKPSPVDSSLNQSQPQILQLQQTIGNHAVQRLIQQGRIQPGTIQRMPTSATITAEHGQPSAKAGKQQAYKDVLDAITQFHQVKGAMNPGNSPQSVADAFAGLLAEYGKVLVKLDAYLDGKKKVSRAARARKDFFTALKAQVTQERAQAVKAQQIIAGALVHMKPVLNKANQQAEMGGALNRVYQYAQGFFKPTHDALPTADDLIQLRNQYMQVSAQKEAAVEKGRALGRGEQTYKDQPITETGEELEALKAQLIPQENALAPRVTATENIVNVTEGAGIQPGEANTSNRDVASARLDELLQGGIIAKAQFALEQDGQDVKRGALMEAAQGQRIGDIGNLGQMTEKKKEKGANKMYLYDPKFMRQLSRLQLLDTLALQVDRNLGNFFVAMDAQGNVTKLTGIDNDMSFGRNQDVGTSVLEYPGLSRYVDEEMANAILALDGDILRMVMADLLSPGELDALVNRLTALKAHLQELKDKKKLLKPDQWNDAVAKGMLAEKSNYLSKIQSGMGWQ